jgi:hypothetical protein
VLSPASIINVTFGKCDKEFREFPREKQRVVSDTRCEEVEERESRTNRDRARNSYIPRFSARERGKEESVREREKERERERSGEGEERERGERERERERHVCER